MRRAAAIFNVPYTTLRQRRAGQLPQAEYSPKLRNLDKFEEVIVRHILDLDHVGVNWPSTFVKRRPELKVKFNRKYDYKRALCEDPDVI